MEIVKILPSRLDVLPDLLLEVSVQLKNYQISENDIFQIRSCLQEALVNAIKHGNNLKEDLSVTLRILAHPDSVEIEIEDQGSGFDLNSVEDPTRNENLCKLSGRGVFLIKEQMDKVEFLDGGCKLKMVKFFKKENA